MHHPNQEHEKQPASWLDAEPDERQFMDEADDAEGWAVSYTHLTLPTILLV